MGGFFGTQKLNAMESGIIVSKSNGSALGKYELSDGPPFVLTVYEDAPRKEVPNNRSSKEPVYQPPVGTKKLGNKIPFPSKKDKDFSIELLAYFKEECRLIPNE